MADGGNGPGDDFIRFVALPFPPAPLTFPPGAPPSDTAGETAPLAAAAAAAAAFLPFPPRAPLVVVGGCGGTNDPMLLLLLLSSFD